MKHSCMLVALGVVYALWLLPVSAAVVEENPDRLFEQARRAYDQQQFDQAADRYQTLIEDGYACAPVYFNLGNARFRKERIGPAVLAWRRAWRMAPRDPDIRANLRFALERAGARLPGYSPTERIALLLPTGAWYAATASGLWAAGLLLVLHRLRPGLRPVILRCMAGTLLVVILSAAAALLQQNVLSRPEVVVQDRDTRALFAPLPGATAHFALPEGALARIVDRSDDWFEIEYGGKRGWVLDTSCARVYPAS